MKRMLGVLALALSLFVGSGPVLAAGCPHGDQCPMAAHKERKDDGAECGCPIIGKVIEKAKFYLSNADAIGLSDQQVQEIKAIKLEAKKASVRAAAEMKVFELDIKAKMSEAKLDVEGLNAMLDEAGKGMSTGAKGMIATYAKLRGLLSEEQQKKAKEIWKKSQ